MQSLHLSVNPFALLLDPQAVIAQIEASQRLERLERRVCRPLDKPLLGAAVDGEDADGAGEPADDNANLDGTELYDVTFLTFAASGAPVTRIMAKDARLESGFWVLGGGKSWPLEAANPEQSATALPEGTAIETDLTKDRIRDSFGTPSAVGFWDLPSYIEQLEKAGFSARSHKVWLQMEIAQPLLLAAMVLIAAGFTMRHARTARLSSLVLTALLCGFAVFFLRNLGQILGDNGQVPVFLAAWTPPVAATLLALGLLLHLEDG